MKKKKTFHIVVPKSKLKEIKRKALDLDNTICDIFEEFSKGALDQKYDVEDICLMFNEPYHRLHLRINPSALKAASKFKKKNRQVTVSGNKKIGAAMILGGAFIHYLQYR
jgi:hypothetical protein